MSTQVMDPSTDPTPGPRQRARVELLVTAERLFAQSGIDSVSLRQIATAAGYSNPATVQYHFGSKEGLCQAIVEYRLPAIDSRREELLDRCSSDDLSGLVEAMARPFLEHDVDSNYIGFLARIVARLDQHELAYSAVMQRTGGARLRESIHAALANQPQAVRWLRLNFATVLMVHAIAQRRSQLVAGQPKRGLREKDFERELLTSLAAVLKPN